MLPEQYNDTDDPRKDAINMQNIIIIKIFLHKLLIQVLPLI